MFVADVKCSQATWQTVPNSRTGSTKASDRWSISAQLFEFDQRFKWRVSKRLLKNLMYDTETYSWADVLSQRNTFRRRNCAWQTSPKQSKRTGSSWRHNSALDRQKSVTSKQISTRTWNAPLWCFTSGSSRAADKRLAMTLRRRWMSSVVLTSFGVVCTTSRRWQTWLRKRSPRDTLIRVCQTFVFSNRIAI